MRHRSATGGSTPRRTLLLGAALALVGGATVAWGAVEVASTVALLVAPPPVLTTWSGGPGLLLVGVAIAAAGALVAVGAAAPARAERWSVPLMATVLVAAIAAVAALALAAPLQRAALEGRGYGSCASVAGVRTRTTTWVASGHPCPGAEVRGSRADPRVTAAAATP